MVTETQKMVARLRQKTGLSANQLSKELGVSRQAVSLWELGHNSFSDEAALKVAELLNEDPHYILAVAAAERTDSKVAKKIYWELAEKFKGAASIAVILAALASAGNAEKTSAETITAEPVHATGLYIMRSTGRCSA